MTAPRVYSAIAAVIAELAVTGIPKLRSNVRDKYAYRSIDDVCDRLAPLLARHKLCVLPRVIERQCFDRVERGGSVLAGVAVRMAFDLISARDASIHSVEVWGEAFDPADKATAKAMSAAYKYAMLQTFCVPVGADGDTESASWRLKSGREIPDPDQGWDEWSADIRDLILGCQSADAVDRVQATHRELLRASSKRRPDLFEIIGQLIAQHRHALAVFVPDHNKGSSQVDAVLAHG